jgi:enamine deaminase RidA (YjgF/YER057c/UK114 family)
MGVVAARLKELGLELPLAVAPQANYIPFVRTGDLVFTAGQIPLKDGAVLFVGKLGRDISVEDAYQGARLCALNILTQVAAALDGDLDRVVRCVKLTGFVNSAPDFTDQPAVVNGASDLIVEIFGEKGKHARSAVGMGGLPRGVSVEVEGIFEVR